MRDGLRKAFLPWKCAALFDSEAAFEVFLVQRNKALNAVRVVLFAVAAVLLFLGYNASDGGGWSFAAVKEHPFYLIAAGVLLLALLVCLVIMENEKQLPEELRQK